MNSGSRASYFYKVFVILSVFGKCFSEIDSNMSKTNEEFVPRVVNGWPAALGDVPYQVAFKSSGSGNHSTYKTNCGGTIVAPTKIISAAHCFAKGVSACMRLFKKTGHIHQQELKHKFAVAGTLKNKGIKPQLDNTDEGQWRALKEVIYPRTYRFPKDDICLVFTTTPFVFNNHVNSIPYARRYADYRGKCLVSGYGRISSTKVIRSDKLLLAHLQIVPYLTCSHQHRKNMRRFICTSSLVTDVGKGDSGGPLVCKKTSDPNEKDKGILVGVVSGHRKSKGSFFTRVSIFYKYIENNRSCYTGSNGLIIVLVLLIENPFLPF